MVKLFGFSKCNWEGSIWRRADLKCPACAALRWAGDSGEQDAKKLLALLLANERCLITGK
eukprot:3195287-Amphidinium_carterae.1